MRALPGGRHLALAGDVSDAAAVERGDEIAKRYGRVDVLVNNAGVDRTPGDGIDELLATGSITPHMSDAGWTRMLEIHLNGAFFCARAAVKRMLEQGSGSIVNMSSIAGLAGMGAIHYSTAKAGLLGFTRSLAREVGARGIRVNAICPGAIETPMTQNVPEPALKGMSGDAAGRLGEAARDRRRRAVPRQRRLVVRHRPVAVAERRRAHCMKGRIRWRRRSTSFEMKTIDGKAKKLSDFDGQGAAGGERGLEVRSHAALQGAPGAVRGEEGRAASRCSASRATSSAARSRAATPT